MRFENYIWDFDGTLCDSYPHTTMQFLRAMGWGMERYDAVFRRLQVTWLHAMEYCHMNEAEERAFRATANSFAVDPYPTLFPGCRRGYWTASTAMSRRKITFPASPIQRRCAISWTHTTSIRGKR